jgi:pyrroline-5-carboxylate reductase
MGIAILSGVLSSLENRLKSPNRPDGGAEPASGISTPTASLFLDAPDETLPSRFITTVGREETGRKLRKTFAAMGRLGEQAEVRTGGNNVSAARDADVILIWYVVLSHSRGIKLVTHD